MLAVADLGLELLRAGEGGEGLRNEVLAFGRIAESLHPEPMECCLHNHTFWAVRGGGNSAASSSACAVVTVTTSPFILNESAVS